MFVLNFVLISSPLEIAVVVSAKRRSAYLRSGANEDSTEAPPICS